jgi:glycine/D-amino acid oxidase-like deaminating enzyme
MTATHPTADPASVPTGPSKMVDAVIVGGGVAGLWLANVLRQRGYAILLLEADALGGAQTLASQGMIHGGIKYALSGVLTGASEAIAGMPERWAACLAGRGDIDLRAVTRLADRYYLFADATGLGKLTTFFASRALRGRIERLDPAAYPAAFADPAFRGVVYALNDFVLDTGSLVGVLHEPVADATYRHELRPAAVIDAERALTAERGIELDLGGTRVLTRRLVLTAGAGTQTLLDALGVAQPRMQLRPLHQVVVRHRYPHPIYAHCLTGIRRPEPRLTITSHRDGDHWLWYLGGQIATDGVECGADALVRRARAELEACVPWVDWSGAKFSTLRLDRAEPAQEGLRRPDQAFAQATGNCIVAWPTKLSLAPDLGDRVLALLPPPSGTAVPALNLPKARMGRAPWADGRGE